MTEVFDITIVGAGPCGLFGAYYSGFRGLKTKIIDSMPQLGGQIAALYPEKYIFDSPGFPKILGKDLVKNLVEQMSQYKTEICLNEQVKDIKFNEQDGQKTIALLTDKGTHFTKVAMLTVGIGSFTPKKYNKPEFDSFENHGLEFVVKNPKDFADKRVLLIGGGDTALDWALAIEPVARNITLIHRRDGFRAHEDSVKKLFGSKVNVKLFYELKAIKGNNRVEEAVIFYNKDGKEETLAVDAIVPCLGFQANLGPIKQWGLELEGDTIKVNTRMETSLPGVFACGDVVSYPGKVKLIATAFGEVATAVNNAAHVVNPKSSVFPGHSSNAVK